MESLNNSPSTSSTSTTTLPSSSSLPLMTNNNNDNNDHDNDLLINIQYELPPDYPPLDHWKAGLQMLCQNEDPPVILVDMDNTLVDWERQFERLMQRHHPSIPIVPPSNRTEFKIELNYNDQYRDPILHLTSLDEFWLSMDPSEGSLTALNEMVDMGLIVFIVTTPDSKHTARSAFEKISWIERYLGSEWKPKTILASDKTLVKGDILIDDRPAASVGLLRPSWSHMLYAQPYNAQNRSCPRLERWSEWGPSVYKLLVNREQEKLRMAVLWDIEGEQGIEKKLSDISDGVRLQQSSHIHRITGVNSSGNAAAASSNADGHINSAATTRKLAEAACCGSARFGSPFDRLRPAK